MTGGGDNLPEDGVGVAIVVNQPAGQLLLGQKLLGLLDNVLIVVRLHHKSPSVASIPLIPISPVWSDFFRRPRWRGLFPRSIPSVHTLPSPVGPEPVVCRPGMRLPDLLVLPPITGFVPHQ